MAKKRITGLPEISNPTLNDEAHLNDVLSNFDKKTLLRTLRTLFSVPYLKVSITNYDNNSTPSVQGGSSFDSKGIPVDIIADATPTGYGGISVSSVFYLVYDDSTGTFFYTETEPTFLELYQGWYDGDDRYLFSMYKDSGGTLYKFKIPMEGKEQLSTFTAGDLKLNASFDMTVTDITSYHKVGEIRCFGVGPLKGTFSTGA